MYAKERHRSGIRWLTGLCLVTAILAQATLCHALAPKVINFEFSEPSARVAPAVAVTGAVQQPGTYRVEQESLQLTDLITRAGGLLDSAGRKIQVVRGGRAGVVLLYSPGIEYKILPGDVVIIEKSAPSRARTISHANSKPSDSVSVVRSGQQTAQGASVEKGHVVLLGLQPHPVVIPIWKHDLTIDELLTRHFQQPAVVAESTTVLTGGSSRNQAGRLVDGMVLIVPTRLVKTSDLPPLPGILDVAVVESSAAAPTFEPAPRTSPLSPEVPRWNGASEPKKEDISSDLAPVAPLQTMTTPAQSAPGLSMPSDGFSVATPVESTAETSTSVSFGMGFQTQAAQQAESNSEPESSQRVAALENVTDEETTIDSRAESLFDFTAEETPLDSRSYSKTPNEGEIHRRDEMHLAAAGEAVPAPIERASSPAASWIGFLAGAIVVVGVVTVIFASIRAHLLQDSVSVSDFQHEQRSQRVEADSAPPVAREEPQSGENRAPVIEERVLLPREMTFFGKPHLQYEFRIDAAHDVPKPHISIGAPVAEETRSKGPHFRRSVTKDDVQWQGQAGLCDSEYALFQQSTTN